MKTDYMVIGRVRNSENITRLVEGIEAKGFSCYNFLHKPAAPEVAHLSWEEQMNFLESHEGEWGYVRYFFIFCGLILSIVTWYNSSEA